MVNLTINDQILEAPEGLSVLQVAQRAGITIPTLCYHKDLTPYGACRLCMVEVVGTRLPATSCNLLATQGMVIKTETPLVNRIRRAVLENLLYTFYDAGYTRTNGTFDIDHDSQFAYWVKTFGIDMKSVMAKAPRYPVDSDPNPFVWVDHNKCILCDRCIRACAEIQGRFVWTQAYRGFKTRVVAGNDTTMLQARCESCGACVAYCPTHALDNKMSVSLGHPDRLVTTTCSYCGVGCQFDLNVKDDLPGGRLLRVTSNPAASVNGMHLCVKGRYGYEFVQAPDRLKRPRLRQYLLDGTSRSKGRGKWVEVDWDTALNTAADGLRLARDQAGPNSVGLLTSGKCLNEENYLMNKLARQVLATNNIDCCAHLYHSSIVDGLSNSFGLGAMTNSIDDITDHACSMLVIGSDTTEQHPVFGAKIRQAVLRRGMKLVVAYPSLINIAEYAALHVRHKLGSDIDLLNGLMYIILEKGWEDRRFIAERTEGFETFKETVEKYPPALVAELTGLPLKTLYQAAETLATNRPMSVLWGMSITQQEVGLKNITSLANLQMLLGNIGIPGGGMNPLAAQNNLQGAYDMGGLPGFYSGYQPVTDAEALQKFEAAWGTALPTQAGMSATEMSEAAGSGKLDALYILCEDPVGNAFDSRAIRKSLEACKFIVLQETQPSETTQFADVLLPGVTFAEKSGTFTNIERRIQMVRQAIEPIGEARPDWQTIAELARRILAGGRRNVGIGPHTGWDYLATDQIITEIAALTPIYGGVSYQRLEQGERLQWPVDNFDHPGTPVLHTGRFARGRGLFIPVEQTYSGGAPAEETPVLLAAD
jgi:predicted molibdopterin-dependent oxidoreductase YjgC